MALQCPHPQLLRLRALWIPLPGRLFLLVASAASDHFLVSPLLTPMVPCSSTPDTGLVD